MSVDEYAHMTADDLLRAVYGCSPVPRRRSFISDSEEYHVAADSEFEAIRQTLDAQRAALDWASTECECDAAAHDQRSRLSSRMAELEGQYRRLEAGHQREVLHPRQAEYVYSDRWPTTAAKPVSVDALSDFGATSAPGKTMSPNQPQLGAWLARREHELAEAMRERDAALAERDEARREREEALQALDLERSDHEATDLLLSDAAEYVEHLKQTCLAMEATIRSLQRSLHEQRARTTPSTSPMSGDAGSADATREIRRGSQSSSRSRLSRSLE